MRILYQTLAWTICSLVMVQAASHAWFSAGAAKHLDEGGTIDLTMSSGPLPFIEVWGVIIHSMSGMYLIPAVAVIFLIVGYFSHIPRSLGYAAAVVVLVAVQVVLGLSAPALPFLAFLHGLNALLIFTAALLSIYQLQPRDLSPHQDRGSPKLADSGA